MAAALERGGLTTVDTWTETIRMWFESGRGGRGWIRNSGYVTHPPSTMSVPPAVGFLEDLFAAGMETYREGRGVPLDLVFGGVVAEKR